MINFGAETRQYDEKTKQMMKRQVGSAMEAWTLVTRLREQ